MDVPRAGFEPASLSARDFKSLVYASSTTRADTGKYITTRESDQSTVIRLARERVEAIASTLSLQLTTSDQS